MRLVAATVCATVVLAAAAGAQQARRTPDHTIDVVSLTPDTDEAWRRVPEHRRVNFGSAAAVATHTPPPPKPLSIRVLGLDRLAYRIGDDFVYELLITNHSNKTVAFPASITGSRFTRDMPGIVSALVSLETKDERTGQQVVGTHALYGAPEVAGSLVMLGPGETLELRAPDKWYLTSSFPKPLPKEWILNLQLHANIFLHSSIGPVLSVSSENAVSIELAGPTERQ
jgi:hypothetical protein